MMKKTRFAFLALLSLSVAFGATAGERLGLGRAATPDEVAAWDIDVRPDGAGLPEGSGDVATGEEVFAEKCAVCHGDFAEGVDRWPVLAGGAGTLTGERPVKTIGSYWPYLSTVWDYVHRAMPFGAAQTLTNDEVYAITAYLLYANDLVDDEFELSRENFTEISLPNEANFIMDDRADSPVFKAREPCMENCKPEVKVTMRAAVLDVTPESEGGEDLDGGAQQTAAPAEAEPEVIDLDLAAAGEKVFRKCKACHQIGEGAKNRTGPTLNGIYGEVVGVAEGFRFSNALKAKAEEGVVWDDATLDAFLADPKDWARGTKMKFGGLKKAADRAAVIEYLRSHAQ